MTAANRSQQSVGVLTLELNILEKIPHFKNKAGIGAEMCPAIVFGIVTRDGMVSYWPIKDEDSYEDDI